MGVSIGLAVSGGVGIAAADGAFSAPQHIFQQLANEDGPVQQEAAAQAAAAQEEAAAQAGAALGPSVPTTTTTTVPSTPTTAPASADLDQEIFRVTDPGPEGTTISVWSERTAPQSGCLASVESATGKSADPGAKPPTPDGGGCSGGVGGTQAWESTLVYGGDGHIWVSPGGSTYMIVCGEQSAKATRVVFTLNDGTTYQARAVGGFFALGIPYNDFMSGGTQTTYNATGSVIQTNRAL